MARLIAVMGSTASGKTALAEALASHFRARLINSDNFQSYRHLDIGTAKPDNRKDYDLLDFLDPKEPFGVGEWVRKATEVLDRREHECYVVVGGSGLNMRALFEGYEGMKGPPPVGLRESLNARSLPDLIEELRARDPDAAEKVDLNNHVRVTRAIERLETPSIPVRHIEGFDKIKIGLEVSPDWVNPRIDERVDIMLEQGWLEEVDRIRQMGYDYDDPGIRAHGYRNLWDVLEGRKLLDTARAEIAAMVRQYAKRQRTWMRTEPNLCKISAEDGRRAVSQAVGLVEGGLTIGEIH